jgi:hypothetical protein
MGRRGQECRCCGCHSCEKRPEVLAVNVDYPIGGGVILDADVLEDPPRWTETSTTCTPPAKNREIHFFITNGGENYTSAPTVTVSGGGGTLSDYAVTLESPIVGFQVTNGGSGYSVAPSVTISGGSQIRAASARAIIEGPVVSVALINSGQGFTGPPTVSLSGGSGAEVTAVMDGYLAAVAITNGGEGYTSAPTVTLSGGGGSGATATALFSSATGVVTGVVVDAPGSGYTSPPEVTISGGGGQGATAESTILFKIASLSLTAGGSGYPQNPQVKFEGSGGSGAIANATISGSVVAVEVLEPGLYRYRKSTLLQAADPNWPTVTIAGPATAEPVFAGKVVEIVASQGGFGFGDAFGWTSEPGVTISGGGGSGATADAELTWGRPHRRRFRFSETCFVNAINTTYTDVTALVLPGFYGVGEGLTWTVRASSSNKLNTLNLGAVSDYFSGEAIWAVVRRIWDQPRTGSSPSLPVSQHRSSTYYRQRFFSRVPPAVVYRLSSEQDPAGNVAITPTFRQYVDEKEDSIWMIEGLQISNAGSNLRIDSGTSTIELVPDGNAEERFITPATFNFSAVQLALGPVDGFTVQPQVSFTTAPEESGGFHVLTAVSVANGGQTDLPDGPVSLPVIVEQGYFAPFANRQTTLNGTITAGALSGVEIRSPFQGLIPPATLATVGEPPQDFITTGRSFSKTARFHSQPTITARASAILQPQVDGVFSVDLTEATDENGEKYWFVSSVNVGEQGNGYTTSTIFSTTSDNPVLLEVQGDGIEANPAAAQVITDRDEPTVLNPVLQFGSGAVLTPVLSQQQQTPEGDKFWAVTSVTIDNPGQGYQAGGFSVPPGPGVTSPQFALGTYEVDQNGSIVAVNLSENGQYYVPTNRAFRVAIRLRGKYFVRTITETSEPLPPIQCIGPLTSGNGWEIHQLTGFSITSFAFSTDSFIGVSDQYGFEGFSARFRRCDFPSITLDWQ